MTYVKAEREAYKDGMTDDIIRIRRNYNLSDIMTKATVLREFITAVEKNQLHYQVEQWVKRHIN